MQLFEFDEKKKRLECRMCCYVIVTGSSLCWTLLSITAFLAIFSALATPRWLVSPPKQITTHEGTAVYRATVGIFNRCTWLDGRNHCGPFNMDGFATDSSVFPGCWKISLCFMALGLAFMGTTIAAALLSFCVQSIGRKSIFNIAGVGQAIAGICYILGMTFYPAGWGAERVQRLCGPDADIFYSASCTFGWAFYCAMLGVLLTFSCALLSNQADQTTSSDKIQDKLNEGKNFVCIP